MSTSNIYRKEYGSSHALIIGINQYQHGSPLGYAKNDAEVVASTLIEKYGFPAKNVKLLIDGDATRDAIFKAFMDYADDSISDDDRLIFFFAGHGVTKKGRRNDVGYLVPCDGKVDDLSTLIRWDDLTKNDELINAKHILYLMDACYGGLAAKRSTIAGQARFLTDMLQRYARQVLTAGKADEVVDDANGPREGHSIFTGYLLNGLDGGARQGDEALTANQLMQYVYQKVSNDEYSDQTPHYMTLEGDGDFIFDLDAIDALDSEQSDSDVLIRVPPDNVNDTDAQVTVELVKEYIAEDRYSIKLNDIFEKQIKVLKHQLAGDAFDVTARQATPELVAERLREYEHVLEPILNIWSILCTWAKTPDQLKLIERTVQAVTPKEAGAGNTLWISLQWYPLTLLSYVGGVSALSNENYNALKAIFHSRIKADFAQDKMTPLLQALPHKIAHMSRGNVFKCLPDYSNKYVPFSEYMFKSIQPIVEQNLFLDEYYEDYFDEFEILNALTIYTFDTSAYGRPGRFGWKRNRPDTENPYIRMEEKVQSQGNDWLGVHSGLFKSGQQFLGISENYKTTVLDGLQWF